MQLLHLWINDRLMVIFAREILRAHPGAPILGEVKCSKTLYDDIAARGGTEGISVGAILGSNITDPVFSLGVGAVFFDVVVENTGALQVSLTYMFVVSALVLGLFYWRRGIDRKAAVVCLLLYVPSFLVV